MESAYWLYVFILLFEKVINLSPGRTISFSNPRHQNHPLVAWAVRRYFAMTSKLPWHLYNPLFLGLIQTWHPYWDIPQICAVMKKWGHKDLLGIQFVLTTTKYCLRSNQFIQTPPDNCCETTLWSVSDTDPLHYGCIICRKDVSSITWKRT